MSGIYENAMGRVLLVGGGIAVPPPTPPFPATSGIPAYLQNLAPGKVLSGQFTDPYDTNATTPWASFSSGSTVAQNANIATYNPAVTGVFVQGPPNSGFGTQQSVAAPNDIVTLANGVIAAGGIAQVDVRLNNPAGAHPLDTTGLDAGIDMTNAFQAGNSCLVGGTTANNNLLANVDAIAALLAQMRGNVLLRLMHECNLPNWWWGWGGVYPGIGGGSGITPAQFQALWIIVWNRLVTYHGLTNLYFVYNVNDQYPGPAEGVPYLAGYPGSQYVDVVTFDSYSDTPGTLAASANGCLSALVSTGRPVGISELGNGSATAHDSTSYDVLLADIKANASAVKFVVVWCQGWTLANNSGATAFMTDSAIINRPALPIGLCHTVPAEASAVGYLTCTFDSTLLGTTTGTWQNWNFYGQNSAPLFTNTQNPDGSFTMTGGGNSGVDVCLGTHTGSGKNWTGKAFGPAYFECTFSFTNQSNTSYPNGGITWWGLDIEHTSTGPYPVNWPGGSTQQWNATTSYSIGEVVQYDNYLFVSRTNYNVGNQPPSILGGVDNANWFHYNSFIEIDFMEYDVKEYAYQNGIGHWYGNPTLSTSNPYQAVNGSAGSVLVPNTTDFSQPHKYGCLWVPATGSGQTTYTQGYLKFYFDDVQTGETFYWNYHDPTQQSTYPAPPPVNGSTAISILDWRHLLPMIGSDNNHPTTVYAHRVWQTSDAVNLTI